MEKQQARRYTKCQFFAKQQETIAQHGEATHKENSTALHHHKSTKPSRFFFVDRVKNKPYRSCSTNSREALAAQSADARPQNWRVERVHVEVPVEVPSDLAKFQYYENVTVLLALRKFSVLLTHFRSMFMKCALHGYHVSSPRAPRSICTVIMFTLHVYRF